MLNCSFRFFLILPLAAEIMLFCFDYIEFTHHRQRFYSGLALCSPFAPQSKEKAPGERSSLSSGAKYRIGVGRKANFTITKPAKRWGALASGFWPMGQRVGQAVPGTRVQSVFGCKNPRLLTKSGIFWSCYPDSNWGPHPYQPTGDLDREYLLIPTDPKKPSDTNGLRIFKYRFAYNY